MYVWYTPPLRYHPRHSSDIWLVLGAEHLRLMIPELFCRGYEYAPAVPSSGGTMPVGTHECYKGRTFLLDTGRMHTYPCPRHRTSHHAQYPPPVGAHSEGGIHILLQAVPVGRHSAACPLRSCCNGRCALSLGPPPLGLLCCRACGLNRRSRCDGVPPGDCSALVV